MKSPSTPIPTSSLESLEPRLAPAGLLTLTAAGGVLTISGDATDNGIQIVDVPTTGRWQINNYGGLTTTFRYNGIDIASGDTIPAQSSIKATLGDGDDQIEILPSGTPSSMMLPGGITINAGKGDDQVYLGSNTSQELVVGAVSVDLGEGDDSFGSTLNGTYTGAVKVLGGLGDDEVRIDGSSTDQVFLQGLVLDLGKGENTTTLDAFRLSIAGALTILDAGDVGTNPSISLISDTLTVDGVVSISVAAGNSYIAIGDETSDVQQFGAGLRITGGTGNDEVFFLGIQTIDSGVTVDLKAGNNSTTFGIGSSFAAASLSILGGADADSVLVDNNAVIVVNAGFSLNLGSGANTWTTDPGAQITAGSLSYLGGTGSDTLNYAGATLRVLGAMTVNTGTDGFGDVDLNPTTSAYIGGLLTITGGKGSDDIDFNTPDLRINAGLRMSLGEGTNSLGTLGASLQVVGGLSYAGGTGSDSVNLGNSSLIITKALSFNSTGAGSNRLYVSGTTASIGSVSYVGGTGSDAFFLGHTDGTSTTRLTVNGAVTGNLGTGIASTSINDSRVLGAFNLTLAGKSTESDSVTLFQSTFNGVVNINTGAGTSTTNFGDVIVRGAFTLNTGAGNDTVSLETTADAAESHWFGVVRILTGAGSDTVNIGTNPAVANAVNNFYRAVIVDGGTESDTLNPAQTGSSNNYLSGLGLTQLNFP